MLICYRVTLMCADGYVDSTDPSHPSYGETISEGVSTKSSGSGKCDQCVERCKPVLVCCCVVVFDALRKVFWIFVEAVINNVVEKIRESRS